MPTVRGTYDLNARPATSALQRLYREAERTEAQLRRTGDATDEIVTAQNIADLKEYQRELSSLGRTNSRVQREIRTQSGQTRRQIERDVAAEEVALATLENRLDRVSRIRATPEVDLDGVAAAIAQVDVLHARLKALSSVRSTPRVGLPSPGFPGGGAGGVGGFGAGSNGIGFGSRIPFGGTGLLIGGGAILGAAPSLIGAAGALGGSLGAATLGAGSIGAAGLGAGAVGGGALLAGILSSVPQIKAASDALSDYRKEVLESGADSAAAREELRGFRQALGGAPEGTRALLRQRSALSDAWQSAMRPSGANVVRGATSGISLARSLTPLIGRSSARLTNTGADQFGNLTDFLNSSGSRDFYRQMVRDADAALPVMEQTTENILRTFMQISQAASPFFHEATEWIESWTQGWADGTKNISETRREMAEYVDQLKSWGRLLGATFDLLLDLGGAGAPAGQSMVDDLTKQLEEWDRWIQRNPQQVRAFFHDAVDSTEKMASALGQIVKMLWQIGELLGPLVDQFSGLVTTAGNLGLLSPTGLPLLMAGGRTVRGAMRGGGGGGYFSGGSGTTTGGIGGVPITTGAAAGAAATSLGAVGIRQGGFSTYGLARSYGFGRFKSMGAQVGALATGEGAAGVKRFGGSFAKSLGITLGLSGLMQGASFQGDLQQRTQAALSGVTLGLVPMPKTDADKQDAATAAAGDLIMRLTKGASPGDVGIAQTRRILSQLRMNRSGMGGDLYIGTTAQGDETAQGYGNQVIKSQTKAWQRSLSSQIAQQQFGDIMGAADQRTKNGQNPLDAAKQAMEQIENQAQNMRGRTGREFSQMGLDWAKAMARSNPKLRDQFEEMADNIEKRLRNLGMNVRVIHGKIVDTSTQAWAQVEKQISTRTERAKEAGSKNLTALQVQAMAILKQMGYNPQQINNIKEDLMAGGQREQVAMNDVRQGPTGAGQRPSTNDANFVQGHAHGGRIAMPQGGSYADVVPVGDNTMAAGDELISNRHTERRVNKMLGYFGTTLGHEVAKEQRGHYKPERRENAAMGRRMYSPFTKNRATGGILRAGRLAERMGLSVGEGPGFGGTPSSGHTSGSLHYQGLAYDVSGSPELMRQYFFAALRSFRGSINELFYDPIGWYIDEGQRVSGAIGGHSDHVHIGFFPGGARGRAVAGGQFLGGGMGGPSPISLKAPKSGLGGIPGLAADGATKLMAAGMEQKINRLIGATGGGGRYSGRGMGQFSSINHVFAEHNSANGDWSGEKLPFNTIAALAEAAGRARGVRVPGVTMAQVTKGESNGRPGATGIDPGGTKGLGLWMVTTGFNDDLIARYGGQRQMLNPVKNALAMAEIYGRQGLGAWYGDQFVTDPNAHYGGGGGRRRRELGGRVPFGGWYGTGGHGVVSSPTLIGVGESGPEEVSIKPLRRHSRIGDTPQRRSIGDINLTVDLRGAVIRNKDDARSLGDEVGRAAAKRLKKALDESSTVKETELV